MINIGLLGPGKIAKRVARGIMLADNANLYGLTKLLRGKPNSLGDNLGEK